jgi:hypothetical protein
MKVKMFLCVKSAIQTIPLNAHTKQDIMVKYMFVDCVQQNFVTILPSKGSKDPSLCLDDICL